MLVKHLLDTWSDMQKAASVQAMLADIFGENCGYFWPKGRIDIPWSQPREHYNLGWWKRTCCHKKDQSKCRKSGLHFESVSKYIQLTPALNNSRCFAALLVFCITHLCGHFDIFKYPLADNLKQIAGLDRYLINTG